MKASHKITVTVVVVLAAIALALLVTNTRRGRARDAATSVATETRISTGEVADPAPELDRSALAELERMGSYLRNLRSFQIRADVVTEDVRTDGQKVQVIRQVSLVAKRPDRLFADVTSDRQRRLFFYDGRHFTLFAPRPMYYATLEAPPTLEKLSDELEDRLGIELPLVDLFRWGTSEGDVGVITAATDLGPSAINGVTCEQYGFRQPGLDWQLWIQRGENPLPCRIVITTLDDEARPQHTATYSWNLAPSFDESLFAFVPPRGANPIPFAEARQVATSATTGGTAQR